MLVPAYKHKRKLKKEFKKLFNTDRMFYLTGSIHDNWIPKFERPSKTSDLFQYAILDRNKKVIGYLSYEWRQFEDTICNFALVSFDSKPNITIAKDVFKRLEKLYKRHHRVEYQLIGGNSIEKSYDWFCKRHNGIKHIMRDTVKDSKLNYVNSIVYELINEKV